MGSIILRKGEAYNIYSTISDNVLFSEAITREALVEYMREEQGKQGLAELDKRLERVDQWGTSSLHASSIADVVWCNRAGPEEATLSFNQFNKKFMTLPELVSPLVLKSLLTRMKTSYYPIQERLALLFIKQCTNQFDSTEFPTFSDWYRARPDHLTESLMEWCESRASIRNIELWFDFIKKMQMYYAVSDLMKWAALRTIEHHDYFWRSISGSERVSYSAAEKMFVSFIKKQGRKAPSVRGSGDLACSLCGGPKSAPARLCNDCARTQCKRINANTPIISPNMGYVNGELVYV